MVLLPLHAGVLFDGVSAGSMIAVEPITLRNALIYKAARLRALRDTPSAFGSTYAKESLLTDDDWVVRADNWNGETSILFLAMDGSDAVGIAGCYLDHEDVARAHLVSMWVAPAHRRIGAGQLLVNEVIRWAHLRMVRTLQLMVTSGNGPAILFYQRLGFTMTGRTEPYPNDPALIEYEMSRRLS